MLLVSFDKLIVAHPSLCTNVQSVGIIQYIDNSNVIPYINNIVEQSAMIFLSLLFGLNIHNWENIDISTK